MRIFDVYNYMNVSEIESDNCTIKVWNIAAYGRTSTGKESQSESIPFQLQYIKNWVSQRRLVENNSVFNIIEEYSDQITGATDERPNFQRMLNDAQNSRINMIIVRDLSRFSRDLITSEDYQQTKFIEWGVRFIAILDGVDNVNEINDTSTIQNWVNSRYLKDCSKKSKAGLNARMKQGSSIASIAPYGYEKKYTKTFSGQKHIELVIADDHTPDVVREIFNLCLIGWGYARIATYLNNKQIEPPSARLTSSTAIHNLWQPNAIKAILTNPKYAGVMAQGQWQKQTYKSKHSKKVEPSKWIVGCEFQGIVSKETFYAVQQALQERSTHRYKDGIIHPFSQVLKCNECKGSMTYRKNYNGYKCLDSQIGGNRCTSHSVKEQYLIDSIKGILKEYLDKLERDPYYTMVERNVKKDNLDKDLTKVNTEIKKLEGDIVQTYQDKLDGIIPADAFTFVVKSMQEKQQALNDKKAMIEQEIWRNNNSIDLMKRYKEKIDKLLDMEEIDRELVEALIDKIVVCEDPETKQKTIQIHSKFNSSL